MIGKSSTIYLGLIALWGIILSRLSDTALVLDGALLLGGVFITAMAVRGTRQMREFADAHPDLALLEGADIIAYKRFEAQAKGLTAPDKTPPVLGPDDKQPDPSKPPEPNP